MYLKYCIGLTECLINFKDMLQGEKEEKMIRNIKSKIKSENFGICTFISEKYTDENQTEHG